MPGPYTMLSVAAVVLGGVSLAGGRGGVFGRSCGRDPAADPNGHGRSAAVNTNLAVVLQGVMLIGVVMIGSLIQIRRARQ